MSPPVTEVAIIPLVKGADPRDENSEAAKILNNTNQLATEQPGYQRMVWGLCVKDPTVLVIIVDWDDLQSHLDFMTAPFYKPFMDNFYTIIDGTPVLFHTTNEEGVGTVPLVELNEHTTDVSFAFFPVKSLTQRFQDNISRVARAVNTELLESNDAPSSIASGWCTDDALEEERPGKGPERPWMSVVTWKNTETRQRAWNREAVLGDIPKLVKGHGELQIYEVKFQPVTPKP
ncbi:Dimeric alpha-beta barrel [Penicillium italicum]|uniref:Dimeric alpha-beta barrel n=1 Tax=Penicillium italicum TaxID=40296 RepID=A0A0A2L4P0_PENIT|nr:Dimeric alpha-beta barrel [Penicillium italicum]